MANKFYFLVIEGIDGSGKSTVSKKLSDKLNCELYKTPSYPFNQIRTVIDRCANIETRFLFYLASVLHASIEIKQILERSHVVCDRYIYSTICYHYALDSTLINFININRLNIIMPDFVFYLNAPYDVRIRRIAERENKKIEDMVGNDYSERDFLSKVEKEFSKFKEMVVIDTEKNNVDDTITQILTTIIPTISL